MGKQKKNQIRRLPQDDDKTIFLRKTGSQKNIVSPLTLKDAFKKTYAKKRV